MMLLIWKLLCRQHGTLERHVIAAAAMAVAAVAVTVAAAVAAVVTAVMAPEYLASRHVPPSAAESDPAEIQRALLCQKLKPV